MPRAGGLARRLRPLQVGAGMQGFMLWVPVEKLFQTQIGFDAAAIAVSGWSRHRRAPRPSRSSRQPHAPPALPLSPVADGAGRPSVPSRSARSSSS
jgi:hypothetical protein